MDSLFCSISSILIFIYRNKIINSISKLINLKRDLIKYEMNLKNIIKYYYHKNKRWDLYFDDNILVKLPNKNINHAIKIYKEFVKLNNIKSNSIIDLRISDRLVIKND